MFKKSSKKAEKEEKPEKPEQEPVIGTRSSGPALWAALVCIPVIIGIYSSISQQGWGDKPAKKPPAEAKAPTEESAPQQHNTTHIGDGGGRAASRRANGTQVGVFKCSFPEWIGRRADDEMEKQVKILHRPYRILPPGSVMTMDHNPDRLNLELDDKGIISRTWCG